jgi:hypothetical protein
MDPNASNPGNVPPPDFDPGQTIVVPAQPAQTGYDPSTPGGAYAPPPYNSSPYQQTTGGQSPTQSMLRNDRDRTVLALLLIGGGVLFLFAQLNIFPGFGNIDFGDFVLLLLGGAFLYAYFSTKASHRVGFLIPGAILFGIGTGTLISHLPIVNSFTGDGDIVPITLGLGFCLIWLLERKHWWALIPGGFLIFAGLSTAVGNLWPVALIIIGVYLLYDQSRRRMVH